VFKKVILQLQYIYFLTVGKQSYVTKTRNMISKHIDADDMSAPIQCPARKQVDHLPVQIVPTLIRH
jgi:hypothetical protein